MSSFQNSFFFFFHLYLIIFRLFMFLSYQSLLKSFIILIICSFNVIIISFLFQMCVMDYCCSNLFILDFLGFSFRIAFDNTYGCLTDSDWIFFMNFLFSIIRKLIESFLSKSDGHSLCFCNFNPSIEYLLFCLNYLDSNQS